MQTGDDQSTFLAPDIKASLRKRTVLVLSIQGCHRQSSTVYFLSVYRYAVHFWLISTSGTKFLCKCKVTPYCSSSDNEKYLKRCEVTSNNAKSSCHRCLQPHLSKLDQQTYKSGSVPKCISSDRVLHSKPQPVANVLNNYFTSIGTKLANALKNQCNPLGRYSSPETMSSFIFCF